MSAAPFSSSTSVFTPVSSHGSAYSTSSASSIPIISPDASQSSVHSTIKQRKEAFVSGLTGGTVLEVYICTIIAVSSYATWCILQARLGFFIDKNSTQRPCTTQNKKSGTRSPTTRSSIEQQDLQNHTAQSGESGKPCQKLEPAPFLSLPTLVDVALNWLSMLLSITIYSNQHLLLNVLVLSPAVLIWLTNKKNDAFISRASEQISADEIFSASDRKPDQSSSLLKSYLPRHSFLTVYRGQMMIVTCLAILAVDFPIFPRRFAKVETWGTSFMDLGVGSFVFSMGLVSARVILIEIFNSNTATKDTHIRQPSFFKAFITSFKHALTVLVLGLLRLFFVKFLDYQEHVTEYGAHWNFFMTLGFLPPVVAILDYVFPARLSSSLISAPASPELSPKTHEHKKNASAFAKFQCRAFAIVKLPVRLLSLFNAGVPTCILALAIATFYEFALNKLGLAAWIITAPRVNVISQNKEGILSFIGYLAIFLLGRATGYYLLPQAASLNTMLYPQTSKEYFNTLKNISASSGLEKKNVARKKKIVLLIIASAFLHALYFFCRTHLRLIVSRRFANLPYVLWVSSYNTLNLAFFIGVELISFGNPDAFPYETRVPASVDAVNTSGLFVFLLANITTGLINMSVNTLDSTSLEGVVVLAVYATVLYLVGIVLKKKGIVIRL